MDIQQASKIALDNGGSVVIVIDNIPYKVSVALLGAVKQRAKRRGRPAKVEVPEPKAKKPRGRPAKVVLEPPKA